MKSFKECTKEKIMKLFHIYSKILNKIIIITNFFPFFLLCFSILRIRIHSPGKNRTSLEVEERCMKVDRNLA